LLKNATEEVTVLTEIMEQHIATAEQRKKQIQKEH
jgi:hypothetical protein